MRRFGRMPLWYFSATLLLLLICALGGCALPAFPASGASASPTSAAANGKPPRAASATPAMTPTPTFVVIPGDASAYGPPCRAQQLSLSLGIDYRDGDEQGTVTNRSTSACSLYGFPGAQLFDAQHAAISVRALKSTADWSGVVPEQYVQVAPGANAYFFVKWSGTPTGADMTCQAASAFAMVPPGDTNSVIADDPIQVCGGSITVSPFQNAPAMSS